MIDWKYIWDEIKDLSALLGFLLLTLFAIIGLYTVLGWLF